MGRVDSLLLLSFAIIFLVVHNSDGSGSCEYKHVNYTECEFMLWTKWTPCDGKVCPQGKQKRDKGVCCPSNGNKTIAEVKETCKQNCNLTDADFYELAPYVPPFTTTTTTSTAALSTIISTTTRSTVKTSVTTSTATSPFVPSSSKGRCNVNSKRLIVLKKLWALLLSILMNN